MIAVKREVAARVAGFSVERMSGALSEAWRQPANLTTSHCTDIQSAQ